jgi:competence protein ComEA
MVGQTPAREEAYGGGDVEEAEAADQGGPAVDETSPSVAQGALVNVNTADLARLQTLPGIGQVKAQAIIDYREANGPFQSIDELDDVPGIGPATLERLRPLVTLGEDATPGGSDT